MANIENNPKTRHFTGFWPTFVILLVAAIAAFTIYMFANGNIVQEQIYSTSFFSWGHHSGAKKTPAKTGTENSAAK